MNTATEAKLMGSKDLANIYRKLRDIGATADKIAKRWNTMSHSIFQDS